MPQTTLPIHPGNWSGINDVMGVDPLAPALGYQAYNYSPLTGSAGLALTSQRIDVAAIYIPPSRIINNIILNVVTAGTSTAPTGFFVGLCNTAKMLAQSSDLHASASLTAAGANLFPLNAAYTTNNVDSPTGLYYVTILQNGAFGGTNVTFLKGNSTTVGAAPSSGMFYGNIGTGQTALPANAAAVTLANSAGVGWCVGVS